MKVKNRKRELTAKEYAEQYEISVRTVKRLILLMLRFKKLWQTGKSTIQIGKI